MTRRSQDAEPQGAAAASREPLPDVLGLSLAELRDLRHPVLREVLEEMSERIARPEETLWDFNQGPPMLSGDEPRD